MGKSRVIFTADDPELRHISISISFNVTEHESHEAKIYSIIDGDTLRARLSALGVVEKVRLLGIDAPETGSDEHARQQCEYLGVDMDTLHVLARISTIHLLWLCPKGTRITLKTTGSPRDDKDRILAGLFIGDLCVNRLLVEHGYAMMYRGLSDWEDYQDLELQAKQARRGIWGRCEEGYYLASSRTYHRPGCSSARYATTRFQTREEARASNLSPCSLCLPDYTRD